MTSDIGNGLIIFGGTGDLTKRKLIPAIYNLLIEELLPDNFFVVAVGRREKTNEVFVAELEEAVKQFSRNEFNEDKWNLIKNRIYYYRLDFNQGQEYLDLDKHISSLDEKYKTKGNQIYYLAVSPEFFGVIVDKINKYFKINENNGFRRVVIEKPFGRDLHSAKILNDQITHAFSEEDTYRIDHYLGKEMLQNIMVIRFANTFFEPIWSNKYIDNIQISSMETLGVSERGEYYEKSGALKDMLQNHLLQFLTLIAMEPPKELGTETIRDEKVRVLKSLKIYDEAEVKQNVIRGQYSGSEDESIVGYRQESRTADDSNTETYIALKAQIENSRWSGVPFYIRTGKRLKKKCVEVIVQFKSLHKSLYLEQADDITPNQLIIRIQPKEGVYLRFNAKKPGQSNDIVPVKMDFCQNCAIGYNSPEAYERLLLDAMKGDKTLFTRWDEVEYSWRFVDAIQNAWRHEQPSFPNYVADSFGPKAADELLEKDGRQWLNQLNGGEHENI